MESSPVIETLPTSNAEPNHELVERRKAYYKTINQEKVKCHCGRVVRKVSLKAQQKTELHMQLYF